MTQQRRRYIIDTPMSFPRRWAIGYLLLFKKWLKNAITYPSALYKLMSKFDSFVFISMGNSEILSDRTLRSKEMPITYSHLLHGVSPSCWPLPSLALQILLVGWVSDKVDIVQIGFHTAAEPNRSMDHLTRNLYMLSAPTKLIQSKRYHSGVGA